jgi:hypothetical protein
LLIAARITAPVSDPVAIDDGWLAVIDAAAHLAYAAGGNYLNLAVMNAAFRADIVAAIDAGHAAVGARRVIDATHRDASRA